MIADRNIQTGPGNSSLQQFTMSINYVLYEAPMGYGVFQVEHQADSIGLRNKETQESINDLARFGKMIKLLNFTPFQ